MPKRVPARELAFVAALKPIEPAVGRLNRPDVVARLAAARPPAGEQVYTGSARDGLDPDLNSAMFPPRWRGLLAAERAGAAHQFDATPALWAWAVDDPTWRAALDTLDVAMRVAVMDMEGQPVTPGMRAAHRLALEIAGPPPETVAS